MKTVVAVLFFATVFSGNLVASGLKENLAVKHYIVSGNSASDIRNDIKELGPVGANKKTYSGYTRWHISWNYRFIQAEDTCKMQSFKATMMATMTLPRWTRPRRVSARLVKRWETFKAALRRHENGHYKIAVAAADEINAIDKKRIVASSCPALKKKLNSAAEGVLNKYRKQEIQYDAETQHGKTQGAVFP